MKKNKLSLWIILACLVLVAVFAAFHLSNRVKVPENAILVEKGEKTDYIDLNALDLSLVEGEMINGKGEVKQVSGDGLLLRDAIDYQQTQDINQIQIVADDEYSATLEASEVFDEDKVYLLVEDGNASLYVSGDKNSKRNVSNVKQIILQ